jgi:hypothetical protein
MNAPPGDHISSPLSGGPEDRPADLDAVLGLVGGGGLEVVLADGPVDAQLPLGDMGVPGMSPGTGRNATMSATSTSKSSPGYSPPPTLGVTPAASTVACSSPNASAHHSSRSAIVTRSAIASAGTAGTARCSTGIGGGGPSSRARSDVTVPWIWDSWVCIRSRWATITSVRTAGSVACRTALMSSSGMPRSRNRRRDGGVPAVRAGAGPGTRLLGCWRARLDRLPRLGADRTRLRDVGLRPAWCWQDPADSLTTPVSEDKLRLDRCWSN